MGVARVTVARLRGLLERGRLERRLDDEVRFHLEMQTEDNLRSGMSPVEARYAALRSFGAIEPMKERYRDRMAFDVAQAALRDVGYAVRVLCKHPSFAASSVAMMALAIATTAVMFSVVNTVLLQPLPYPSPERLAMVWTEHPTQSLRDGRSAYWNVDQWRQYSDSFVDLAVFDPVSATLASSDTTERIGVARVSPNFFGLLGVQAVQGRVFTGEEADERRRVVLISHRFWQTRFGGSPDAVGASINLEGEPSLIVGVLPASFQFSRLQADVWEPHTLFPDWEARRAVRGEDTWFVVGRLRPNATFDGAQKEMSLIASRLDALLPAAERNRGVRVEPLSLHVVGSRSRLALWMLAAAVLCVFLIAAANIASLALARSVGRAREMAIRTALGAGRVRLVRQLVAESVTLAAVSGVLGTLLAFAGIHLIRSRQIGDLARLDEVALDLRVLGSALAASVVMGMLVGLAPAITVWRGSLPPLGLEGGRSVSGGAATRRVRRMLVVGEFALAIVLLVAAGLLVRSWWYVEGVDPGFRFDRVLAVEVRAPVSLAVGQRVQFFERVLEQIESIPGVERAGLIGDLLIGVDSETVVTPEDDAGAAAERLRIRMDDASAGVFATLGIPLIRGRFFSVGDGHGAPRVAIINEALARRLWPGRDPVGRRFAVGSRRSGGEWLTVIGLVGDMRRQGLEREPISQVFEPLTQRPSHSGTLLIRTSLDDPLQLAGPIQAAVRQVDQHAPLYGVNTLEQRIGAFLTPRRYQTSLVVGFSIAALLMAAIGIYGLVQYSVATRTQEFGLRMAVGAQDGDILRMVVGEGLTLSTAGLGLGLAGALAAGQAARGLLYGVTATDPLTFAGVSLLLTMVAASASYLPARQAMKVEPITALRRE